MISKYITTFERLTKQKDKQIKKNAKQEIAMIINSGKMLTASERRTAAPHSQQHTLSEIRKQDLLDLLTQSVLLSRIWSLAR